MLFRSADGAAPRASSPLVRSVLWAPLWPKAAQASSTSRRSERECEGTDSPSFEAPPLSASTSKSSMSFTTPPGPGLDSCTDAASALGAREGRGRDEREPRLHRWTPRGRVCLRVAVWPRPRHRCDAHSKHASRDGSAHTTQLLRRRVSIATTSGTHACATQGITWWNPLLPRWRHGWRSWTIATTCTDERPNANRHRARCDTTDARRL